MNRYTAVAGARRGRTFGRTAATNGSSDRLSGAATAVVECAGDIEQAFQQGFRGQRFPGKLESLFELETQNSRRAQLFNDGIVGVIVYVAFLISDYFMIPDVMGTALVVRLGIVTPLSLVVLFLLWWGVGPVLRELMEASLFVILGTSVVFLVAISSHPNAAYFHNMTLLIIVYANAVVRLRFRYAVGASVAILLIYLAAMPLARVAPPPGVQLNYVAVMVSAIAFTLFANYSLERSKRTNYLYEVRARIQRAELVELSRLDPLTGIHNRRALDADLERFCGDPRAWPVSLIMIDVDSFKPYNDRYGHQAGDECLRRLGSILQASLRFSDDRVARYGGEEFVVVLPRTDLTNAMHVAERIRRAVIGLSIPHHGSPFDSVVTVSGGVVTAPSDPVPTSLFAAADQALYRAKAAGRNTIEAATRTGDAVDGAPGPYTYHAA